MFTPASALPLDPPQKQVLESLARAGRTPQLLARKCEVILLASEGVSNNGIAHQTGLSRPTVIATRTAFVHGGVDAIRQRQKRKRSRRVLTPELERKILDATLKTRPPDATHWSVRTMARHLGVTRTLLHGVWQRHDVQPHRVEKFKLSNDPKFEECSASTIFTGQRQLFLPIGDNYGLCVAVLLPYTGAGRSRG